MTREEAFKEIWAGAAKDLAIQRRFRALYRPMVQKQMGELVHQLLKARDFGRRYGSGPEPA